MFGGGPGKAAPPALAPLGGGNRGSMCPPPLPPPPPPPDPTNRGIRSPPRALRGGWNSGEVTQYRRVSGSVANDQLDW
jgi:hypothetical protein